jgi:lipoyl(octanoyl) transferase
VAARPPIAIAALGRIDYASAFALQKDLVAARVAEQIPDCLLLLEHPPTITHSYTGRGAEHLLGDSATLAARGVTLHSTDRGGDITFHGPGQLVGYPIIQLDEARGERDLHRYLRMLEEVLIATATSYGVNTCRVAGRTGTWTPDGGRKLAAIGVKASRWVTLHGFALNVSVDLSFFELIVPCGLGDAGVVNLGELVAGPAPSLPDVAERVADAFCEIFGREASPPGEALSILLRKRESMPWP